MTLVDTTLPPHATPYERSASQMLGSVSRLQIPKVRRLLADDLAVDVQGSGPLAGRYRGAAAALDLTSTARRAFDLSTLQIASMSLEGLALVIRVRVDAVLPSTQAWTVRAILRLSFSATAKLKRCTISFEDQRIVDELLAMAMRSAPRGSITQ